MTSSSSSSIMPPPSPVSTNTSTTPRVKREGSVSLTSAFAFATPPSYGKGKKAARPIGSLTPFGIIGGGSASASGGNRASPSASRASGASKRLPPAPLFTDPGSSSTSSRVKLGEAESTRADTPLRAVSETCSSISLPPPGQRAVPTPTQTPAPPAPSQLVAIKKEDPDLSLRKTPKKLSALSTLSTSPFLPRPGTSTNDGSLADDRGKRRRLGEVGYAIPAISETIGKGKGKAIEGKTVGLGAVNDAVRLEEIDMDEWMAKKGKEEVEVEVGIGISPRKGKVKWNGRGDPPLSLRLASLTSTESASLTLFYTSLYHTLNPTSRAPAKRSRPAIDASAEVEEGTVPKAISALSHIRTAPIRLVLVRPASSRMHNAHLWIAAVLRWPRLAHPHGGSSSDDEKPSPSQIMVNLALPSNSSRPTGVDPRKVEERWRAEGPASTAGASGGEGWVDETRELVSTWEVGVWSEWGTMDLPRALSDGEDGGGRARISKVLFATRFLVAEGKLRET